MALVGYARVSSIGQNLDVQLEKLEHCDKLFQEKHTGTSANRPQLRACLEYLREGDVLVITRLDRLARSTAHLCDLAETLQHKGVNMHVLDQQIDTASATGRLLFNMLGSIGQFETEIRAERQAEGIAKAKKNGVAFGRKTKLTVQQQQEMRDKRDKGVLIRELMQEYRLSKAAVYRYLKTPHLSKEEAST